MTLNIADYVLIGIALAALILGGCRGLSGTLALFFGTLAAVLTARFLWPCIGEANFPHWVWIKFVIDMAVTLVVFGVVRVLVSKSVRFLLATPADTLLGGLAGLFIAAMMVYAWAYVGNRVHDDCPSFRDCSNIVRTVAPHVG